MKAYPKLRSLVFFVSLLCLFAIFQPEIANAKTLKMYAPYPEESYLVKGVINAVNDIRSKTNGKINIKVFPAGQLGGYEEILDEVKEGTVEIAYTWTTGRYDERLTVVGLPGYAPMGYQQFSKIMFSPDSIFSEYLSSALGEMGLECITIWPEPYAPLLFSKGRRPDSFEGYDNKKRVLRVPGMIQYRDTVVAMGYQTVTMNLSETWTAMQTGQIDGHAGNPLEAAWLQGKDIVGAADVNRLMIYPGVILFNKDLWKSFSREEQKIVKDAFVKEAMNCVKLMEQKDNEYKKQLKDYGVEIIEYSDDYYKEIAAHQRKVVWPKYYSIYGKEFLDKLDELVVSTSLE